MKKMLAILLMIFAFLSLMGCSRWSWRGFFAGMAGEGRNRPMAPSYQSDSTVYTERQCYSDFDCGLGNRCVKQPLHSSGICMKEVDAFGLPTYGLPSLDSVGPNMNMQGACDFDVDCPIGFRCDLKYKICIR